MSEVFFFCVNLDMLSVDEFVMVLEVVLFKYGKKVKEVVLVIICCMMLFVVELIINGVLVVVLCN